MQIYLKITYEKGVHKIALQKYYWHGLKICCLRAQDAYCITQMQLVHAGHHWSQSYRILTKENQNQSQYNLFKGDADSDGDGLNDAADDDDDNDGIPDAGNV